MAQRRSFSCGAAPYMADGECLLKSALGACAPRWLRCDLTRAQSFKHLNVRKTVRLCHTARSSVQNMVMYSLSWIVRMDRAKENCVNGLLLA
jgi:hypothetical protein